MEFAPSRRMHHVVVLVGAKVAAVTSLMAGPERKMGL